MLKNYLKIAFRNLHKQKVHSFINIFGLTVGITSCILIGLYVLHERSYDRFHTKADRIYRLAWSEPGTPPLSEASQEYLVWGSAAHAPRLEADFPEIEHAVRLSGRHQILLRRDNQHFQEERYFFVDPAFFGVFSFHMLQGDPAKALERPNTIVLSESAAQRYFSDGDAVGQTLLLESGGLEGQLTVTGVMADVPANSHLDFDILISMSTFENYARANDAAFVFDHWGYADFFTYVLLGDGISAEALQEKFPGFLERHYGDDLEDLPQFALEPIIAAYHSSAGQRQPLQPGPHGNPANLYLFSFIGAFILIIACFNFMNLATARSVSRAKEVGIRKTVGAHRGGLIGQFLTEAVLVASMATGIAILLTKPALPFFRMLADRNISEQPLTDPVMLGALILGTLFVGFLAGSYPAFILSRFRPSQVLKGGFSTSGSGARLRKALVVLQFTAAVALIAGTVIIRAQLDYLHERPLGFDDQQQLVLDFGYDSGVIADIETIKQEMKALPGVHDAAATRSVPGGYFPNAGTDIEAPDGTMQGFSPGIFEVDTDFLPQLGLPLLAGRFFSRDFSTDTAEALMINEAAAHELGYADPAGIIGKRFTQWGREGEVVGVVKDFNHESLHHEIAPLSFRISSSLRYLVLRVATEDANQVVADVRSEWNMLVPHRPFLFSFLDQSFDAIYRSENRFAALFGTFAALAIIVACLGLFGLTAFAAEQRTKEIGIRKVMGASVAGIVTLLSKDFLKLVLIGFVIATPIAWYAMNRWLEDFAYRIEIGPGVFLLAGLAAILIALATVSWQSVRAALMNPVESLRSE